MTPKELRELIGAAELNQRQAADELGLHRSTVNKYLKGDLPIPAEFAEKADPLLRKIAIEKASKNLAIATAA